MIRAIAQPARSLPQGLGEASWAPRRARRAGPRAGLGRGRLCASPREASGQHLNPPLTPLPQLWPHSWQPGGSQAGGKPQRREQEPGRFQSTWPDLEFTQLICKSNANLSSFIAPLKNLRIRPFWK